MGDLPLRTPNDRRLGGPLPRRPANHTHAHPFPSLFITQPCGHVIHTVLGRISPGYPPERDRLHTRYSPVRRSPSTEASFRHAAPRLACVRPVASVHPEPGSNSSLYIAAYNLFFSCQDGIVSFNIGSCPLTWTTLLLQCVPVLHLSYLFQSSKDRPLPQGETYGDRGLHVRKSKRFLHTYTRRHRSESGCKSRTFTPYTQIFYQVFSRKNISGFISSLLSATV